MCYGIGEVATQLVTNGQDAAGAAAKPCGAVVLKAEVAGLVHKSDAGAVQLDLHGRREGRAGYRAQAERFGPRRHARRPVRAADPDPPDAGPECRSLPAQAPVTLSRLLII
jgi:acyl-CoA synthetase (NDP forming)